MNFNEALYVQRELEKSIYMALGIPPVLLENPEPTTFSFQKTAQEQYNQSIIRELNRIQSQLDDIKDKAPKYIVPQTMARLFKQSMDRHGLTYRHKKRGIFEIYNQHGFCAWMYIVPEKYDKVIEVK